MRPWDCRYYNECLSRCAKTGEDLTAYCQSCRQKIKGEFRMTPEDWLGSLFLLAAAYRPEAFRSWLRDCRGIGDQKEVVLRGQQGFQRRTDRLRALSLGERQPGHT